MTTAETRAFRHQLKSYCIGVLQNRLNTAMELIARAQEGANNESKSSAGDKYETGRAMGQLEKQMYQQQAAAIQEELSVAGATDVSGPAPIGRAGSLVVLPGVYIFVCVGIGRVIIDGMTVFIVSPNAPIARALQHQSVGDTITLGAEKLRVQSFM